MKRVLQFVGILLVIVLVLLLLTAAYVYAQSNSMINTTYEVDVFSLELPEATDDLLDEGRRIFVSRGCIDCHGIDAAGTIMADDAAFGRLVAPNLTEAYSSEDVIRAVLHGVGLDGRGLQIMPSMDYTTWREEELSALVAYITNLEPIDNELPTNNFGPLYRALIAFNQIPVSAAVIDHDSVALAELDAVASVEYGQYLSATCVGCHGSNLAGATVPGSSMLAPNLTPHNDGLDGWTLDDFATTIQTGMTPDGRQLDPAMPYAAFASFTYIEVEALYLYLQSLEPIAGN